MDPTGTNVAIARALGLDPDKIAKDGVKITLDGRLGPVVEVTYRNLDEDRADHLAETLARYKLVPLGGEEV